MEHDCPDSDKLLRRARCEDSGIVKMIGRAERAKELNKHRAGTPAEHESAEHLGIVAALLGLIIALPASAQVAPSQPSSVDRLIGICGIVSSQIRRQYEGEAQPAYVYERQLFENAGIELSDPPEVVASKMQAFWQANNHQLRCDTSGFNVPNGYLLKFAVARRSDQFLNHVLRVWRIDLNWVDPADDRTTLDYIRDEQARTQSPATQRQLNRYYQNFRAAGALHRTELEAAGLVASVAVVRAEELAKLKRDVEAGNTSGWPELMHRLTHAGYASASPSEAVRWLAIGEARARARADWTSLARVGDRIIMNGVHGSRYTFVGTLQQGRAMVQSAFEGGEPEATYPYGYALMQGLGGPRDLDRALIVFMRQSHDPAITRRIAEIHLARGNREEAILWLRQMAQTGTGWWPFLDTTVSGWLADNGLEACGMTAAGTNNCRR